MLELDTDVKDILVIVIFHSAVTDCIIMGGGIKTDAKAGITVIISNRIRDLNKPLFKYLCFSLFRFPALYVYHGF